MQREKERKRERNKNRIEIITKKLIIIIIKKCLRKLVLKSGRSGGGRVGRGGDFSCSITGQKLK